LIFPRINPRTMPVVSSDILASDCDLGIRRGSSISLLGAGPSTFDSASYNYRGRAFSAQAALQSSHDLEVVHESTRALAHAAHKHFHEAGLPITSAVDFRAEMERLAAMNTAELRDYVWLWMCPDRGNCDWMRWWEAERSEDE
jgi:hypothetical protein